MFLKVFRQKELEWSRLADEDLLKLYRLHKDTELVGELFTRYTHLVYGLCLSLLEDPEQARDAVMQIFEGLIEALAQNEIRHFSSWLYKVSRNHCLMEIRKGQTRRRASKQLSLDMENAFVESNEETHLNVEAEVIGEERLRTALDKLNGEQRQCLELMYLEEKSYHQIVEITGMEWNQVKSHIQNGKRMLRKLLGPMVLGLIICLLFFHVIIGG